MSLQSGDVQLTPQERLEKVWNALEMPDNLKLDMAIKYSTNEYYVKLFEVSHYCTFLSISSFCIFEWCIFQSKNSFFYVKYFKNSGIIKFSDVKKFKILFV